TSIVAADPPARPVRLQAERRADAEAEADPVGELVRQEERREWLCAAGVAAVPSGQRGAADGFIQARAVVLEGKRRPYQEPRRPELRTLEEGHAGRVVEDGGGVLGDGSLSGVGAAQGAAALLEEQEPRAPGG